MRLPSTALIAAAAALTLAACGDGVDVAEDAAPDETTEAPDDADDAGGMDDMDDADDAAGGGDSVSIVDNSFEPDNIEVAEGDTVEWVHDGDISHNVTFDDEASDTLESGDTYSRSFDEAGEFEYTCTFHPGMSGTVTVG